MSTIAALSGYTLVPATEAQDLEATKREWVEWGQPLLSQDQFVTREKKVLGTSDFSAQRRQRWVLVPADDTTTLDFFAGCETYRRPILVRRPGNNGESPVERGLSYSVCSVFVPEGKRRNGYANKMMTLLQHNLSPQGKVPSALDEGGIDASGALVVPLEGESEEEGKAYGDGGKYGSNATCSFLYSDIGEYYSQFAWKVVGNRHVEWKPSSAEEGKALTLPQAARWLTSDELKEVGAIDREYLLSQLRSPSNSDSKTIKFCLDDPQATSWRWLIKRSNYYATTLLPSSAPKPSHFGLLLPGVDGEEPSYVVWMFDFIERKVAILRLRFSSKKTFALLIGAVRKQAADWEMNKCLAWNVDLSSLGVEVTEEDEKKLSEGEKLDQWEIELEGGSVVDRKGNGASLPALAWYGDRKEGEKIEWLANEYGWWC